MKKNISSRIRANIGCGMTPILGWKNFDNSLSLKFSKFVFLIPILRVLNIINSSQIEYIIFCKKNSIIWADAKKHIPLPDESVEVLYSSHMIEHLDKNEVSVFLSEAMRVLKSGGILRLVLPDLALLIDRYIKCQDADAFLESTLMCAYNPKSFIEKVRSVIVGNRHHLWMYDEKSIYKTLEYHGFTNIKILVAGETTMVQHSGLDLREREGESIYVEAYKS